MPNTESKLKQKVSVRIDSLLYGIFVYFNTPDAHHTAADVVSIFKGWYGINLLDYKTYDEITFLLKERGLY